MSLISRNTPTFSKSEVRRQHIGQAANGGLHLVNQGNISLVNSAAAEFGTSDFSVEFILNQTGDNTNDNYIFYTHEAGNNRLYIYNDISADSIGLVFVDSSGSASTKTLSYDMSADYGTPTHYVVTCDRSGNATLYKNGNSVASVDISSTSAIDIGASNTNTGLIGTSANGYGVIGTFSRFRTFNKLADAKKLFERNDIEFSEQWGSQTSLVDTNASTFEGTSTYSWNAYGTNTVANTANQLVITYADNSQGAYHYLRDGYRLTSDLTLGKKYKFCFEAKYNGGSAGVKMRISVGTGGTSVFSDAFTTSMTKYELEFTPVGDNQTVYVALQGLATGNVVTIDNYYLYRCGAVTDFCLSEASPSASLMLADRSTNSVDGTISSSGVSAISKPIQINATAIAVSSSTALTPADGEVVANALRFGGTSSSNIGQLDYNSGSGVLVLNANSSGGNTSMNFATSSSGANATRMTIDSAGNASLRGSGTAANKLVLGENNYVGWESGTNTVKAKIGFSSSGDKLVLNNGGNDAVTITSAGNVAIGSSAASEKLHLMADGSVGTRIERASSDGNSGVLDFYKTRGTLASKSIVGTADTVGALRAFGYDGSNYIQGGEIAFKTNGTPGTNDMPTQFVVSTTADGAASPTVRMTISSSGLVTATSANQTTLSVVSSNAGFGGQSINASDGTNGKPILSWQRGGAEKAYDYVGTDNKRYFNVNSADRMSIDTAGLVTANNRLSVVDNAAGATTYANFGPTTIDGATREGGIQIHTTSGSVDKTWGIFADAVPNSLNFNYLGARATAISGGTNALSLSSTGLATFANGITVNGAVGSFASGIFFSGQTGTSATGASTTTSVLNHYEEGTWTPVLKKGSTTHTGVSVYGKYIRVGKLVWISFYIYQAAGSTQSASGSWNVSGLPFAIVEDATAGYQQIPSGYFRLNGSDYINSTPHRWQANDTTALTIYGNERDTNWASGAMEFQGTGVVQVN